ncbi:MAG: M15 family metallopeptidase [Actinomycetota bacterium]
MKRLAILALTIGLLIAAPHTASPLTTASPPSARIAGPEFVGTIERIDAELREKMTGVSWHAGCPVPIRRLRLLTLDYWGFDGEAHRGRLIVRRRQAEPVLGVFHELFNDRFPIRRVRMIEPYGADDDLLGRKNVTSGFNCRLATGGSNWSQHAYGLAIDINPVQNPYVNGDVVLPARGRRFLDRSLDEPGMVHEDDVVVQAFVDIGWEWGGNWTSIKDYMHFSLTGN